MKVLIATKNPAKISGAKEALDIYYNNVELGGVSIPSNVPEQPVNEQVIDGAKNRLKNLKQYAKNNNIEADLYLATEAGLINMLGGEWGNVNYVVIEDKNGKTSFGTSSIFPVPNENVEEIISSSLSAVMDRIFEQKNSGQSVGGIRYLTNGAYTRGDLVKEAFVMALTKLSGKW